MNPPGGDISPEGGTLVQMVAEQVIIDFRQSTDDSAKVTAWFLFHNTGNADEHLKVRFPLNGDPQFNGTAEGYIPLIKDFTALINGQQLITRVVKEDDPNAPLFFLANSTVMYWSVFDVDFPIGKDVKLTVKYTLQPTEETSHAYISYILATGAGWKGPIGKADVVLRFPYILNNYNLRDFNNFNTNNYFTSNSKSIRSTNIIENELWLHWEGLEPTDLDNIYVPVVQPHLWQVILQGRIQAIGSPDDASVWLALARAYASAGQERRGMFDNEQLCQAFIKAFERALTLNPNDASLHAEFAYDMFLANWWGGNDYYQAIAMNELAIALSLDPKNPDAISALDYMNSMFPDLILPTPGPFPIFVTATPTLEPIAEPAVPTSTLPSPTPHPTATLIPAYVSPQPTILPAKELNRTNSNLAGLVILLTVVFAGGIGSGILINRLKRS
jgi:tetratricopeptide (TPR) repeat protein